MSVLYVAESLAVIGFSTTVDRLFEWWDGRWREREIAERLRAWEQYCGYRVTLRKVK